MRSFWEIAYAILIFFRIVDRHDGLISLTNIATMVCIARIATMPDPGPTDLGVLLIGLMAYTARKVINRRASVAQ